MCNMNDKVKVTFKALVAYYLKNGVKPIDIYLGHNDTIVFLFNRSDTKVLYGSWMANRVNL